MTHSANNKTEFDSVMGMPCNQRNAYTECGFTMRAGIPQAGGKLTFHAFENAYSVMVSASAFWDRSRRAFRIPEACNLHECDMALDSAGFTSMSLWKSKGQQPGMAGVYPWTMAQYIELAALMSPAWWSAPDLCCEPEVARDTQEVRRRIEVTATLLEGTLRTVYAWQEALAGQVDARAVANMLAPPVPILQGWDVDSYLYSLDLTMQVWERWQPWVAAPSLIGIGSVCRRSVDHPTHGLYALLRALDGRLPSASRVHLFGVKGQALQQVPKLPWVASADSMAYDFGARVQARESGQACDMRLRTAHMSHWMGTAAARVEATAGLF